MDFSSPSSSSSGMNKNQMMSEVRNQMAIATAQELIQVRTICTSSSCSIRTQRGTEAYNKLFRLGMLYRTARKYFH